MKPPSWLASVRPPGVTRRVLLLRHGHPQETAQGICYGKLDVGLSERGRLAIAELGPWLQGSGVSAVMTSPRIRARESALGLRLGGLDAFEVDEGVAEFDFGDFEGLRYEAVQVEHAEFFARWMSDPTEVEFPGGESHARMHARVEAAASRMAAQWEGRTMLVATHGGVIRTWVAGALGMPRAHVFRLDVDVASLTCIDYFGATPLLRALSWRPPV